MKILVTGCAGFIGLFTSGALLDAGHEVVGIDNFNEYYDPALKRARVELLADRKGFQLIEADLADREAVDRTYRTHEPEVVLHLAAQAGVRYSLVNPYAYQQSNLQGFINLIEGAHRSKVRRFVYASSSSVYGGNTKMPYSEDDPVNTPVSLYAATKRANELFAHTYTHLWGLQTVGLRFFTVYGPWGRPDMAYWSFLENILISRPIKVFNYGKNRRDFTYIDDVTLGVMQALTSTNLEPYEIINLGNNTPVELMTFIRILEDLAGRPAEKQMVGPQPGDVVATYADIDTAQRKLDFHPTTKLEDGLNTFVKWFLDNRELTRSVSAFRRSE